MTTPLDALEQAERRMTPAPWKLIWDGTASPVWTDNHNEPRDFNECDQAAIALLRNHAADLIAVARAVENAVSTLETWLPSHSSERLRRELGQALAPLLAENSEKAKA